MPPGPAMVCSVGGQRTRMRAIGQRGVWDEHGQKAAAGQAQRGMLPRTIQRHCLGDALYQCDESVSTTANCGVVPESIPRGLHERKSARARAPSSTNFGLVDCSDALYRKKSATQTRIRLSTAAAVPLVSIMASVCGGEPGSLMMQVEANSVREKDTAEICG